MHCMMHPTSEDNQLPGCNPAATASLSCACMHVCMKCCLYYTSVYKTIVPAVPSLLLLQIVVPVNFIALFGISAINALYFLSKDHLATSCCGARLQIYLQECAISDDISIVHATCKLSYHFLLLFVQSNANIFLYVATFFCDAVLHPNSMQYSITTFTCSWPCVCVSDDPLLCMIYSSSELKVLLVPDQQSST